MPVAPTDRRVPIMLLLEVEIQTRFIAWAAEQLSADVTVTDPANYPAIRIWFSIQSILVAAANIRKVMWGGASDQTERLAQESRREPLRNALALTTASPLYTLEVRNDLEHFDDRIDHWGRNASASLESRNVGHGVPAPPGSLGHYDSTSGIVSFEYKGHSANIPDIVAEAARILPLATAEYLRIPRTP